MQNLIGVRIKKNIVSFLGYRQKSVGRTFFCQVIVVVWLKGFYLMTFLPGDFDTLFMRNLKKFTFDIRKKNFFGSPLADSLTICWVFRPANGCFPCCSAIKNFFFVLNQVFPSFSISNGKKKRKRKK